MERVIESNVCTVEDFDERVNIIVSRANALKDSRCIQREQAIKAIANLCLDALEKSDDPCKATIIVPSELKHAAGGIPMLYIANKLTCLFKNKIHVSDESAKVTNMLRLSIRI